MTIHTTFFYLILAWLAVLIAVTAIAMIKMPSVVGRILAFDTMSLILIGPLALFANWQRSTFYLDVALLLAMFAFLGTMVASRYEGTTRSRR